MDHTHFSVIECLMCLHEACFETNAILSIGIAIATLCALAVLRPLVR